MIGLPRQRALVDLQVVALDQDAVGRQQVTYEGDRVTPARPSTPASGLPESPAPPSPSVALTVLDLGDVAHHQLGDGDLGLAAVAHDGEALLLLDAALQPPELAFLAPVVEGGDEDDAGHRQQDGRPLDPARLRLPLVLRAPRGMAADCGVRGGTSGHGGGGTSGQDGDRAMRGRGRGAGQRGARGAR